MALVYAGGEWGADWAGAAQCGSCWPGPRSRCFPPRTASHTPNPTSVTVAGSLQSEVGCPGDWDPACATTHLAYDANDDVWQGTFSLPAGDYEYKAALNDAWAENYGLHADRTAPTSRSTCHPPRASSSTTTTRATGSPTTTARRSRWPRAASSPSWAAPSDWDPGCLRSWLQDIDGDGIYSFETTALPAGSYEAKVAINEAGTRTTARAASRTGRTSLSPSRPTTRRSPSPTTRRRTSSRSRSAIDHGAPGGPGALSHFDLARKDCLGTARNTTSKVWYTVAGVLSDVYYPTVDNTNVETLQYIVTDGSTFTDLQTRDMTTRSRRERHRRDGLPVTATAKDGLYRIETTYVTDPSRNAVLMPVAFTPDVAATCSCSSASIRRSTATAAAARAMAAPTRRPSTTRAATRSSSPSTRSPRPTPPTATTPSRSSPRSTARSPRLRSGSPARRATASCSSTTPTR